MANLYSFSVQRKNRITGTMETFAVTHMASFDEARKEVEKGIHDQELKEEAHAHHNTLSRPTAGPEDK